MRGEVGKAAGEARRAAGRVSESVRDQKTREAIFEAARGRGKERLGAYPVMIDPPDGWHGTWDPVQVTRRMIENDYPSCRRLLSQEDWNSLHAILAQRAREIIDERSGASAKKKRSWMRRDKKTETEEE